MLVIATLWTLGATNQASANDLLDRMLGGSKVAASCGCAQKSGGHVQRCGSKCTAGHVQHTSKVASSHVQRAHVQRAHVQRAGNSKGGHVQRADKGGKKGGVSKLSATFADLKAMMQERVADARFKLSYAGIAMKSRMADQMDSMKGRLASFRPKFSFASGKGKSSDIDIDIDAEGEGEGDADTAGVTAPETVFRVSMKWIRRRKTELEDDRPESVLLVGCSSGDRQTM
jgi:hypothetical protein